MANKLLNRGNTVLWENDTEADVASNDIVVVNGVVCMAEVDIAVGETGVLHVTGRAEVVKASGQAWTALQKLYWDATNSELTTTPTVYPAGVAGAAAASSAVVGELLMNFASSPNVTVLNKLNGTTAPTASDDTADGYAAGSIWVDTTNDRVYVCLDATAAAAVWQRIHQTVLNNDAATSAPGSGDDTADGYSVGSRWTNVTTDKTYFCQDATAAAAVWVEMAEV